MMTITIETARRFILGKQGLWPGRRRLGIEGTEQAIRAMEYLQLDPLHILARSQDIGLHSRVLDYTPGLWEDLAYQQRQFFDWGGWLALRPMDGLPDFRVVMRRERDGDSGDSRIRRMAREHAEAIDDWMKYEPGSAAPHRGSGCGWPSILAPRFCPCSIWVPAHNMRRTCSSIPATHPVSRSSPVMA